MITAQTFDLVRYMILPSLGDKCFTLFVHLAGGGKRFSAVGVN